MTGDLRLTTARWYNKFIGWSHDASGQLCECWSKALAHTGQLVQFRYGTDTPSDWNVDLQVDNINAPHTGTIAVDVDDEAAFMTTRTARHLGRADACSTRGSHFHVLVDARGIPAELWPVQGMIHGRNHIKSNGFIPVPGSRHYTGALYQPVIHPGNITRVVIATPQMIADMVADRADFDRERQAAAAASGSYIAAAGSPVNAEQIMASGAAVGGRNDTLYRLACSRYRRHGTGPAGSAQVIAELEQAWQASGTAGMPRSEVLTIALSARGFIDRQVAAEQAQRQAYLNRTGVRR